MSGKKAQTREERLRELRRQVEIGLLSTATYEEAERAKRAADGLLEAAMSGAAMAKWVLEGCAPGCSHEGEGEGHCRTFDEAVKEAKSR